MEFKNLNQTKAFKELEQCPSFDIKTGLCEKRVEHYIANEGGGLQFSYAALPLEEHTIDVLQSLADEQELIEKYQALLSGTVMNTGENRLVLHHLTRGRVLETPVFADGVEKGVFYQEELEKIRIFSEKVRNGEIVGSTGKKFTTIVQIGIGGSDLGPRALCYALDLLDVPRLQVRFISNVDPDDAKNVLDDIDVETTLFILVSKSGTTQETLTNRDLVLQVVKGRSIPGFVPEKHLVAVTSNTSPLARMPGKLEAFYMDDYIGGRYSSTSSVGGVVLSLAYGFDVFEELLAGAHEEDIAALQKDIRRNGILMDALAGVYLRNVIGYPYSAVLPYSQELYRFPAHLQQLDMESNGKHVNRFGEKVDYETGPVIFGEPGTNGQHSFYQLLHQGTDIVPMQFIGFRESQGSLDAVTDGSTSQTKLNANLVAQVVAFAMGQNSDNPNKEFEGGRPSSLLIAQKLTPRALGALLSHFENKIMFQGFVWNINSFDQEGVQLGKKLAKKVLAGCQGDENLIAYSKLMGININ